MRHLKFYFICLFIITLSCSKDEDDLNYPNEKTDHEITLHPNNRVTSLLMGDSEYRDWIKNDGFSNSLTRKAITNDLYKKFPDKYDFIFFVLNEPDIPESLNYYGKLVGVSNNVEGTGQDIYDYSSDYGSGGKLKSVMQLSGLEFLTSS